MAIIPQIEERWSPRAFAEETIPAEELLLLFTAAGMAASSFNEQPWRFIVARKEDEHYARLFEGLNDANKKWAFTAPVIGAGISKKHFSKNDKSNAHNRHDFGLAMGNLCIQAMDMGIYVHQMAGIQAEVLAENFKIDTEIYDVVSMFVLGYPDAARIEELPEKLQEQERKSSPRKDLKEILFGSALGENPSWL